LFLRGEGLGSLPFFCAPKKRPVICPRARNQAWHPIYIPLLTQRTAQCSKPISLFKSSTGVEMPHHVDIVLVMSFWNKAWLEQSLEQEKPCRIKELHGFVPVFQCSDQEMWFGKVKIKLVRSFEAFCECKAKNHFSPYPLRTVRTLEQLSFRPLLLLLYIIYYIYKTRTYRVPITTQKPCSSSISKVTRLRTSEHKEYQ